MCDLHNVATLGGRNKKFGQCYGTPRGKRHAITLRNVPIPGRKGEIKRARVGGGCIGELKSDSLSRESKPRVTWNSGPYFFLDS